MAFPACTVAAAADLVVTVEELGEEVVGGICDGAGRWDGGKCVSSRVRARSSRVLSLHAWHSGSLRRYTPRLCEMLVTVRRQRQHEQKQHRCFIWSDWADSFAEDVNAMWVSSQHASAGGLALRCLSLLMAPAAS